MAGLDFQSVLLDAAFVVVVSPRNTTQESSETTDFRKRDVLKFRLKTWIEEEQAKKAKAHKMYPALTGCKQFNPAQILCRRIHFYRGVGWGQKGRKGRKGRKDANNQDKIGELVVHFIPDLHPSLHL